MKKRKTIVYIIIYFLFLLHIGDKTELGQENSFRF